MPAVPGSVGTAGIRVGNHSREGSSSDRGRGWLWACTPDTCRPHSTAVGRLAHLAPEARFLAQTLPICPDTNLEPCQHKSKYLLRSSSPPRTRHTTVAPCDVAER